ncbi:MAG: TetR/AcrR family transcriptional regulator [Treponema sp.]|nr:TetR/AcrR family transcriptional regulator [Treponema sp.]
MTKTEIINAAFRVWGRNFYRKTSLSQLACELRVSKPALYRHFLNKQALTAAMTERFLDDFAGVVREDFENALQAENADEGISTIVKSICGFFARNVYSMIFSMINIYERNIDGRDLLNQLKSRGVDFSTLSTVVNRKYKGDDAVIRLIFTTLTFFMSHYHKVKKTMCNPLSDEDVQKITSRIFKTIKNGLGYSAQNAELDFDRLEKLVENTPLDTETEPFFKAVAEAVAETGPWEVSMEMVAKRLGLSKSSLYGHFKNRKDMLRRLFISEFMRIIEFARKGINSSSNNTEQLFLGIYSIAVYLRSRPEILIAMDWIRTRRLDLGKPDKRLEVFNLFEDVDIEPLRGFAEEKKRRASHWILFLLINILIHPGNGMQNDNIRLLYKFVTLGLGGFNK